MRKERMPEVKTASEKKTNIVVANSLEEYVRELSQRMILPKGKIENFKGILASPDQLAPLVEKIEDTRIELRVTTPSRMRFSISSDIKAPKNKEKLKTASRSVQLASLAEAEARFRVIRNSEHIPDQVRYVGFNLDRTISKLHKQAEKLVKGEKVFGKTKAEKKIGILAFSLAVAACGRVSTPIQPTPVEPVATEVAPTPIPTKEVPSTPTAEVIESTYQLEDGVQLERMEKGQLVELFPGSEVFMSERGDVVIINKETGIQLAGQRIETKYGSYTFLMADSAYQYIIRSILDEKEINLDEEVILSRYPADWVANNKFKQEVLKVVEDLRKIQGFKEGKESLGGYPNLAESPYKEELTRVISTLLALKEKEISLGSVNLANYQPKPKDFVMVTMKPGNAQRLASILPEGLIDPNDPASMVIYTGADVGYPVIKAQNGVYFNAFFTSTVGKPLKDSYEAMFYHVFTPYFTKFPWRFLVRDAGRVHGINVRFSYSLFWEGPFAPLFSNLDIYGHLTAFNPERSPYKPPYTVDQNWEQQNWVRFGTSEVVEIDFEKFK